MRLKKFSSFPLNEKFNGFSGLSGLSGLVPNYGYLVMYRIFILIYIDVIGP